MGCYILTRIDKMVSFMSEADTAMYCLIFDLFAKAINNDLSMQAI